MFNTYTLIYTNVYLVSTKRKDIVAENTAKPKSSMQKYHNDYNTF